MVRLPTVGGDCGTWGTVLNEFLSQEHDSDGTHGTITPTDIKAQGPWVDVRNYASFSAAITAIGSDNKTLLIPNEQTVSADVTVPSNVHLLFIKGGSLSIDSGVTVTINGPLTAGLYQIFSGDGSVSFGSDAIKEAYPEWWGIDGTADDVQIQAALDSGAPTVRLAATTYSINATITITATPKCLVGAGKHKTTIDVLQTDGTNGIEIDGVGHANRAVLKDFTLSGNSSAGHGIFNNGGSNFSFEDLKVTLMGGNGLEVAGGLYFSEFNRCEFAYNDGDGVHFDASTGYPPNANIFLACKANNNGGNGFNMDYGSSNTIIGGDASTNTGWGLDMDEAKRMTVLGIYIENNTGGGIRGTTNTQSYYIIGGKAGGTIELEHGIGYFLQSATSIATGGHDRNYLGPATNPTLIGNLIRGHGNELTIAATLMNVTNSGTFEDDDRALVGRCIKLDLKDDSAEINSAQILSPNFLKPGKYKFFVYAKSTAGTANALRPRIQNKTDSDYMFDISVTPPTGDVYVPLPTGGVTFTIDDTEHNDQLKLQIWKSLVGDDANDIYISHVLIIPCDPAELEASAAWDPGSIAAGAKEAKEITVSGAELGDFALASFSLDVQDLVLNAQVTAADTITCVLANNTGAAVDLGAGTVYVKVTKK